MKKALSLLFLFVVLLFRVSADTSPPGTEPEYYYTRVMYSGVGTPERGGPFPMRYEPLRDFKCSDLERGEGGLGGGWRTDYPASDCKFIWGVERLTSINAYREAPHPMQLMDPKIFDFPYLYIVEPGQMLLSNQEAARLREFLLRGGFLHADDFWGVYQLDNFAKQMAKVFPDRKLEPVPLTDEIFHTFFDIDTVMQIPNVSNGCYGGRTWESSTDTVPRIFGIRDDKSRLMVIVTYNSDLGDAWEHMDVACYPEKFSGQAYRMGINFIIYAMTH
ncbi:MAG: transmembrane prediction [Acidobacteria bacterium]|nr:MAG: transmembrane prediction [Acidobacteriota bacterium]